MNWHKLFSNRAFRLGLVAVAALILLYAGLNWPRWQLRATMATGFGARLACACRYIEKRALNSCETDFEGLEGMGLVHFKDDPATQTVRASIPMLSSRSAKFRPGFGCIPDKP